MINKKLFKLIFNLYIILTPKKDDSKALNLMRKELQIQLIKTTEITMKNNTSLQCLLQ